MEFIEGIAMVCHRLVKTTWLWVKKECNEKLCKRKIKKELNKRCEDKDKNWIVFKRCRWRLLCLN